MSPVGGKVSKRKDGNFSSFLNIEQVKTGKKACIKAGEALISS